MMTYKNDGRIPGGPTTPAIKEERKSHISSLVFAGPRYDYPDVKLREHGEWRSSWKLTEGQMALVEAFGFHHVDAIRVKRRDRDLVLSIVERWWPSRNTFQLPFGEMTITLSDVAQILGLPIEGVPIYLDEKVDAKDLIRKYLGVEPPSDMGNTSTVRLTWLRSTFMHVDKIGSTTVNADYSRVICCTRAYLLCLCGAFLFPDSTGNMINVRLLPYLEDLDMPTIQNWGEAVLAHLYHSMTYFVRKVSKGRTAANISGCLTLVQFWCYEHFEIGRPLTTCTAKQVVWPGGIRWNTENTDCHHNLTKVVSFYRHRFDTLTAYEVVWEPLSVPEEMRDATRAKSLHRYYIMYNRCIMFHPADRVMRQFGLKQMIPQDPLPSSDTKTNLEERVRTYMRGWPSRFITHGVEHLSELMTLRAHVIGNEDFLHWYGCPLMQNRIYQFEEPRIQVRAVDDYSLRERSERVNMMMETLTDIAEGPDGDPTGVLGSTVDFLRPPMGPHLTPLDIPDGHPVGIVKQRQARPRRTRDRGASSSNAQARPRQVGEGTSQANEGMPQQYEGTSQSHAGMSHTYAGMPQTYEGTSYPYGGSFQPYTGMVQPYEGMTQHYASSTQPYAGMPQPYEGTLYPYAGSSQPYAGMAQPYEGMPQHYEGTSQPDASMTQQYEGFSHPYAGMPRHLDDISQGYHSTSQSNEGTSQSYEGTPQAASHDFDWDYYMQSTGASLFGSSSLDPASQLYLPPSEGTEERRDRLGLRRVDRRDYRRDDRGG